MKISNLRQRVIKKGKKSICRFSVVAVGINKRGTVISIKTNRPRFSKKSGGIHAEMGVMIECPKSLCRILIARINKKGEFLPIDPCSTCLRKAKDLNIKIDRM